MRGFTLHSHETASTVRVYPMGLRIGSARRGSKFLKRVRFRLLSRHQNRENLEPLKPVPGAQELVNGFRREDGLGRHFRAVSGTEAIPLMFHGILAVVDRRATFRAVELLDVRAKPVAGHG